MKGTAEHVLLQLDAVSLVTVTETYLQDVLAYAAQHDESFMRDSEQTATYKQVLAAVSIEELRENLRRDWAKKFVNKGGPRRWKQRLEGMGARGFVDGIEDVMELHWGVRHVVVHNAGNATPDFVQRHPTFGAVVGEQISVTRSISDAWCLFRTIMITDSDLS